MNSSVLHKQFLRKQEPTKSSADGKGTHYVKSNHYNIKLMQSPKIEKNTEQFLIYTKTDGLTDGLKDRGQQLCRSRQCLLLSDS